MTTPGVSRSEQKERTRRAILDAALALAEEGGLAALSLRQVAKEIGIVPTAFYRHFASIDELGLTLVAESFDALRALLRDARTIPEDPAVSGWELSVSIANRSIEAVVTHARQSDQHLRFIARERLAGPPTVRDAIRHQLELIERELATDIAHLPFTRTWSASDLAVLANLLVNAMLTHAEELSRATSPTDTRRIADTARRQLHIVLVGALRWDSSK
jgi:AcrR family transcriptional regulator